MSWKGGQDISTSGDFEDGTDMTESVSKSMTSSGSKKMKFAHI